MSFVTTTFIVFLIVVFTVYRLLPHRPAKVFLCLSGLFFYAYWFPPYLLLLLTSGVIDYFCSLKMRSDEDRAKMWMKLSVVTNLSFLVFFKYTDFFLSSVYAGASLTGMKVTPHYLHLILPLGISFYTFQSLSYTIDVYRKKLEPCSDAWDFFLYLSFFPHLVAGPILRASDIIPQLEKRRALTVDDWYFFIYRFSRGFFLKTVVADNVAPQVVKVFAADPSSLHRTDAVLGMVLFSVQIFCDFAGYSDIAIGTAKLFGLGIKENFTNPYFASSIGDFWRRWHISLSSWFRDYLYIPLGGSRVPRARAYINIFIVFLVSGFWHGANWTFIAWGAMHGTGLLIERRLKEIPAVVALSGRVAWRIPYRAWTLLFVMLAWVAFRAQTLGQTLKFWQAIVAGGGGLSLKYLSAQALVALLLFGVFYINETLKERKIIRTTYPRLYAEAMIYFILIMMLPGTPSDFIYFQF